eukprot:1457352-Pyramimonas_sp.AAC.1
MASFVATNSLRTTASPALPARRSATLRSAARPRHHKKGRAGLACTAALNPSDVECLFNCGVTKDAISLVQQAGNADFLQSFEAASKAVQSDPKDAAS